MGNDESSDGLPPSDASEVIESFAINLLAMLLKRGVIEREEASQLLAGVKTELRACNAEAARAETLAERLDQLAWRVGLTKLN